MTEKHLTPLQLADRWQISPRTLEAWRGEGIGPEYMRIVGKVRYKQHEVEAFEAKYLVNTTGKLPMSYLQQPQQTTYE